MLHRHRGTLAVLALGTLAVGLILAGGAAWMLHLPHPDAANRGQLLRWLVLRDLALEPRSVRSALVNRLQTELDAGLTDHVDAPTLSPAYRERLASNCALLQHDWLIMRSHEYHQLKAPQRVVFLDRQITTLMVWCETQQRLVARHSVSDDQSATVPGASSERETDAPANENRAGTQPATQPATQAQAGAEAGTGAEAGAGSFFDQLETWLQEADSSQRPVLERAVTDSLICWLSSGDLRQQPHAFRLDLAERIATSLDAGATGAGLVDCLDPLRREKLRENCQHLMEVWLHARAAQYQDLSAPERTSYIDHLLDRLTQWDLSHVLGGNDRVSGTDGVEGVDGGDGAVVARPTSSIGIWLEISELIEQWIQQAEPDQRTALRRLVAHLQQRMLWRQFQSLLPSRTKPS